MTERKLIGIKCAEDKIKNLLAFPFTEAKLTQIAGTDKRTGAVLEGMRRFILFVSSFLLLTAAAVCAANVSHRTRYHYELRNDLHLHFSNSDAVIAAIRQGLRRRDNTIIVTYRSHANNMDEIPVEGRAAADVI